MALSLTQRHAWAKSGDTEGRVAIAVAVTALAVTSEPKSTDSHVQRRLLANRALNAPNSVNNAFCLAVAANPLVAGKDNTSEISDEDIADCVSAAWNGMAIASVAGADSAED